MRRSGVVLALLGAVVLGGCGADSEQIDTSGIDQLMIPTPSPDPDDFVSDVDNPFLPLEQGNVWVYDATFGTSTPWTVTVTVEPEPVIIAGVATTAVESLYVSDPPGAPPLELDYYAQDVDGNVWWFGRRGEWEAGEDGAEAGLAMPATPRVGDGWRRGYLAGTVEDRLTVVAVDGDRVTLRRETDLEPGAVTALEYAKGFGLVSTQGPGESSELSAGP
jgi:hypothetical protein